MIILNDEFFSESSDSGYDTPHVPGPRLPFGCFVTSSKTMDEDVNGPWYGGPGYSDFDASYEVVGHYQNGDPIEKLRISNKPIRMRFACKGKPNQTIRVPFIRYSVTNNFDFYGTNSLAIDIHWEEISPSQWVYSPNGPIISYNNNPGFYEPMEAPYYYVDRTTTALYGVIERDDDNNDRVKTYRFFDWVHWNTYIPGMAGLWGTLTHRSRGCIDKSLVSTLSIEYDFFRGFLGEGWFNKATLKRGGQTHVISKTPSGSWSSWWTPPSFSMPMGANKNLPYLQSPPGNNVKAHVYRPPEGFTLQQQTNTKRVWVSNQNPNDKYEVELSEEVELEDVMDYVKTYRMSLPQAAPMSAHLFDEAGLRLLIPVNNRSLSFSPPHHDKVTLQAWEMTSSAQARLVYSSANGITFQNATLSNNDDPLLYPQADVDCKLPDGSLLWGFGIVAPNTPYKNELSAPSDSNTYPWIRPIFTSM
jgi:hypothetical protein